MPDALNNLEDDLDILPGKPGETSGQKAKLPDNLATYPEKQEPLCKQFISALLGESDNIGSLF